MVVIMRTLCPALKRIYSSFAIVAFVTVNVNAGIPLPVSQKIERSSEDWTQANPRCAGVSSCKAGSRFFVWSNIDEANCLFETKTSFNKN
jgi:hypothetical protein